MGLSGTTFGIDLLVKIVPRNPVKAAADGDMLAVIFFALMVGVGPHDPVPARRPSRMLSTSWTASATSRWRSSSW